MDTFAMCGPRWDAKKSGISFGTALFAEIFVYKLLSNLQDLYLNQ